MKDHTNYYILMFYQCVLWDFITQNAFLCLTRAVNGTVIVISG